MHPVLFEFGNVTVYSYGFFIALGAFLAYLYTSKALKKSFDLSTEKTQTIFIVIILAAIVGGKLFVIFEDPSKYLSNPGALFKNFGSGFVFYGSLIFAIPSMIFLFRKYKLPMLATLDVFAFTACIVHACGRMGCFFAGCCHGIPTESFVGVTFTDPSTAADPMNVPLHPTQLYSFMLITGIFFYLLNLKKRKSFDGQLFLTYIILYGIGRFVIEYFRGDEARGYVIENVLSNSQLISIFMVALAIGIYYRLKNRKVKKVVS